jgi:hypothetical protein
MLHSLILNENMLNSNPQTDMEGMVLPTMYLLSDHQTKLLIPSLLIDLVQSEILLPEVQQGRFISKLKNPLMLRD